MFTKSSSLFYSLFCLLFGATSAGVDASAWLPIARMLASGGSELVSLGAVLPFLAMLSDPGLLWEEPWEWAARFGFTEHLSCCSQPH